MKRKVAERGWQRGGLFTTVYLTARFILQPLESGVFRPQKSSMRWFMNSRVIHDATETIRES